MGRVLQPAIFPAGFGPSTYGASFADVYDRWYDGITDSAATARFMAARCSTPTVVELGVGTGRLVADLSAAGLTVIGVDASLVMLSASDVNHVRLGADIASLPLRPGARVGGAICAFNTLFNLPTAELQRRVFIEAAAVVEGPIVIEAMTGSGLDEAESQSVGVSRMTADSLVLAATVVNHEAQTVTGQHVDISEAGIRLRPWHLRWSTPAQLDQMAADAGLQLTERYADWDGSAFDSTSDAHISVYR